MYNFGFVDSVPVISILKMHHALEGQLSKMSVCSWEWRYEHYIDHSKAKRISKNGLEACEKDWLQKLRNKGATQANTNKPNEPNIHLRIGAESNNVEAGCNWL